MARLEKLDKLAAQLESAAVAGNIQLVQQLIARIQELSKTPPTSPRKGSGKFECADCGRRFKTTRGLKSHISRSHDGSRKIPKTEFFPLPVHYKQISRTGMEIRLVDKPQDECTHNYGALPWAEFNKRLWAENMKPHLNFSCVENPRHNILQEDVVFLRCPNCGEYSYHKFYTVESQLAVYCEPCNYLSFLGKDDSCGCYAPLGICTRYHVIAAPDCHHLEIPHDWYDYCPPEEGIRNNVQAHCFFEKESPFPTYKEAFSS